MKLYMDLDNVPIIPHIINKVPNLKGFIEAYLQNGARYLIGHTKAQQFWFNMCDDGILEM